MVLGISCSSIVVALLLLLMILYAVSQTVRYRLKFVIYIILVAISATAFIPLMVFRPRDWRNASIPAFLCNQVGKLLGVNIISRGHENIVDDTGSVVLINHQSGLDLLVLSTLWLIMDRCTVVSKKEILYLGPFGLASWLWGTIFIDRLNAEKAQNTINSTAEIIKKKKAKLCLFPEGKRHAGTTLLPFKKGAFHVAVASQIPIQPVVVSRYYFLNDKLKKFDSGTVYVTILPAIPTAGLTKEDIPTLIEKVHSVMNKTFQESSQEVLVNHAKAVKSE
ncbi:1-acyl-sn-glycerol-3-phosphate acyltransferase alpha [Cephus cinctus]|uniref:1-acyl-sn-glycerol-3-phosphate acyltransferase n=1 Tax=Cephus cinctus TaxID=211228 RepID=A0AAJ7FMS8_CEPCN|nr:1-acyl-sn-glycerol-3-phosphate acyltransferase alpha [Cephus cinctus]